MVFRVGVISVLVFLCFSIQTFASCPNKGGEMVLVPKGPFLFGYSKVKVTIPKDYCMDRMEVTSAAYNECIADGVCTSFETWPLCQQLNPSKSPNQCFPDRGHYPANYINWYRAEIFCRWAGKRLPFGAEWEKAARGVDGRTYPWGENPSCSRAHYGRSTFNKECFNQVDAPSSAAPVGSYLDGVSPYGVLDMAGNLKEWIEFRKNANQPPLAGEFGVTRGGSYLDPSWSVTTYSGDNLLGPDITSQAHGFRCAADPL